MDLELLEAKLGVKFHDQALLLSALTHSSYILIKEDHPVPDNERLEFLGDAVIHLLVAEYVYLSDNYSEGVMTDLRTKMVNGQRIASLAMNLDLWPYILADYKETRLDKKTILGDCFEAIVGALHLDQGGEACREFLARHLFIPLPPAKRGRRIAVNPKLRLNNEVQESLREYPRYFTRQSGTLEKPRFTISVYAGGREIGRGAGETIKGAEYRAVANALHYKLYKKPPDLR
jgi:ribonuclease III